MEQKDFAESGRDILFASRNELYMSLPYLDTALCALVLTLFHFPCGTTCFTIWKETRSVKWTSLAILLPTAVGAALCMLIHLACTLIQ